MSHHPCSWLPAGVASHIAGSTVPLFSSLPVQRQRRPPISWRTLPRIRSSSRRSCRSTGRRSSGAVRACEAGAAPPRSSARSACASATMRRVSAGL